MKPDNRPLIHFAPEGGWMNDPNGPIRTADGWHIFYQKSIERPDYRVIGWGHARSDDLIAWTDLGMAIPPGDRGWVYSGSVIPDPHRPGDLLAFFTRHDPAAGRQTQERARSRDGGTTWAGDPDGPLIDEGLARFRDPFIVAMEDGGWRMLTVKPIDWHDWRRGASTIAIHASDDLRHWRPLDDLGPVGGPGEMFEVPVLLRLAVAGEPGEARWLLLSSVLDRSGEGAACRTIGWIGDFDGARFAAERGPFPLDHGPDFYAATAFAGMAPDGADGAVLIGWLNSWAYARRTPADYPRGASLTMPRRIMLARDREGALAVRQAMAPQPPTTAAATIVSAPLQPGRATDLGATSTAFIADLTITWQGAARIEIGLREGRGHRATLSLDRAAGTITLDRAASGQVDFDPAFAGAWTAPLAIEHGRSRLGVVVDRGSIEVFPGDGDTPITMLVFPFAGQDGASATAFGGAAHVAGTLHIFDR